MVNIIGKRVDIQPIGAAAPDNGLGAVMAGLGKAMFGDTLTPALKREQMQKLVDENEVRKSIVSATGADGYVTDPRVGTIGAMLGVIDPNKMGRMQALQATHTGGVDSPRAAEALTGLGEYNKTPLYGERDFANKLAVQQAQEATKLKLDENKLVEVQGPNGPVYARQSAAVGQAPSATSVDQVRARELTAALPTAAPEQRRSFIWGNQPAPDIYVGTTAQGTVPVTPVPGGGFVNAQTGQPVTEPLSSVGKLAATSTDALKSSSGDRSALLGKRVAMQQSLQQIDALDQMLAQPDAAAAVGFLGRGARFFNDLRSQTEAAVKTISPGGALAEVDNPQVRQALGAVESQVLGNPQMMQRLQSLGIDNTVLRSHIIDLAYTIAKAKDPSGRMSNQDIDRAAEILGGALMDPVAGRKVLQNVRNQIVAGHDIYEQEFNRMFGGGGAPAAPALPPTGQPQQPQQPRQAPDGNFYVPDPNRPGKYLMVKP